MTARREALQAAFDAATSWLDQLSTAPVRPSQDVDEVTAALWRELPDEGLDPRAVVDELVRAASPGLMGAPSGRFFGWVIGGTLPAALAADWLTSAWDQNAGLLASSPASAAVERVAGRWLLDLLGLPPEAGVGFTTGATMANVVCLAAARHAVLDRVGWDVEHDGLVGAPPVTVVVGAERHSSVELALRYLGLGTGRSVVVPADERGRLRLDALADTLAAAPSGPVIVVLQAGNVHSGDVDPVGDAADLAHGRGAWVHVDGAFGLWAAASPALRTLLPGLERADSWATDGHKTLNVPYDSGLAFVADAAALHAAMGEHADYLLQDERPDPMATVPEMSRRARGFAVWAALRSLGRQGVAELVDGLARHAAAFAAGLAAMPGVQVVNDVVFTQVCASFGSDERTRAVAAQVMADGTTWMTPSRWHGHPVLRISVSNWSTSDDDVARSLDAVARAVAAVDARGVA